VYRLVGRTALMVLILAALLAPFPALASLDEPLPGLEDDDGDAPTGTLAALAFVAGFPVTGPRLDAPVGSAPLPVAAAQSPVEPASADEPFPRSPPHG